MNITDLREGDEVTVVFDWGTATGKLRTPGHALDRTPVLFLGSNLVRLFSETLAPDVLSVRPAPSVGGVTSREGTSNE